MDILNKICQEKSVSKIYKLLYLLPLNILNTLVDTIRKNIDKIPENKKYLSEAVLVFYLNKDKLNVVDSEEDVEDVDDVDLNLEQLDFEDNYLYSEYGEKLANKYMLEDMLEEDLVEDLVTDINYKNYKQKMSKQVKPKIRDMPTIEEMNADNERALRDEREEREKIKRKEEKRKMEYEEIKLSELDEWYTLHQDKINDDLSIEEQYDKMINEKKKIKDVKDTNIAEQKEIERTKYKPREHKEQKRKPLTLNLSKDDIIEQIESLIEHREEIDNYGIVHKKRFDISPLYKKILLDILNNKSSKDIAEKYNIDKTKIHKTIKKVKGFFSRMFQGINIDIIKKQTNKPKKKENKDEKKTEKAEIKFIKPYQNPEDIEIGENEESDESDENIELNKELDKYRLKHNKPILSTIKESQEGQEGQEGEEGQEGQESPGKIKESKESKKDKNRKISLDEFIRQINSEIKLEVENKVENKVENVLDLNKLLKCTKMCDSVKNNKKCNRKKCNFAHSIEELRIPECFNKENCRNVQYINGEYVNKGSKVCKNIHPNETKENYLHRVK